jgi:hypothetical protein
MGEGGPSTHGRPDSVAVTSTASSMQKLFSVKDKSLSSRSWDADGSAQDLWDEDYAVINFRGEEVFRTPSRIEAERWIRPPRASSAVPSIRVPVGVKVYRISRNR